MNASSSHNKNNLALLVARVVLAVVVAAHGAQKLFGWFGGYGFGGTVDFFTQTIGIPYWLALLIILTESVGMIALLLGWASRALSVSIILIMIGAIFTVHAPFGFYANWSGSQGGEGYEFHLVVIALAFVVALQGAGAYSLDHLVAMKLRKKLPSQQHA